MALQSNAQVLPDDEEVGSLDNLAQEAAPEPEAEEAAPAPEPETPIAAGLETEEVPDPLKGKTPKEIAEMYMEAQRMIGRHATELGELRRMTDTLVKKELERRQSPEKPAAPEPKTPDPVDYFADPEKAINAAVERHPLVKKLIEENQKLGGTIAQSVQERATARFNELHPDAGQILSDDGFRKWVGGSKIRQQLLLQAHTKYDVDAGHELLSTWKELNARAKADAAAAQATAAATSKATATAAAQAASVPSGGNASPAGGGKSNGATGKMYRRVDIMRLMEEDPDRYEAMADEIQRAYAEGRVK